MNPKAITLDLGGTRIKIGTAEGEVLIADSIIDAFSDAGLKPRLPAIEAEISALLTKSHLSASDIAGIGISIPGIVDSKQMKLLSVNEKYADAVGFDFAGWAMKNWNLPVVLENDARCALIGEWQYGAGKGCDNLVMVTLGTGIGGAAIIDGKVVRGKHFQAGILPGHFTVNYHGAECNCGNVGCVEAEASSWRLPDLAARNPLFKSSPLSKTMTIDYKEVFDLAERGDALSEELVRHSIEVWSACVVNLIHAYDPEMAIIGGGIMRNASRILPAIASRVEKHSWTPWGKVRIVPAAQTDFAALLGAGYLVCHV
ncbi:MAG: ROK family protein [Bacteroidetes bacterium]|nr:ROK family protein [Bacteroidota bacterium]